MKQNRESLIEDLVGDLQPVARPGRVGRAVAAWLAVALVYSVIMVVVSGPLRPGALRDLADLPGIRGRDAACGARDRGLGLRGCAVGNSR